jgi:hypothetical protein
MSTNITLSRAAILAGLALCLNGCAGQGGPTRAKSDGLSKPAAQPAPKDADQTPVWAKGEPLDIQALLDKPAPTLAAEPPRKQPSGSPTRSPAEEIQEQQIVGPAPGTVTAPAREDGTVVSISVDPVTNAPVNTVTKDGQDPEAAKPIEQRIDETAVELIDLITQQSMAGQTSWRNYIALAALDVLHHGALPQVITPGETEGGPLSVDDRQAVESIRDFFRGITALPADLGPDERAEKIAELSDTLVETRPPRIRTASLCSRVTGFGQFVPLSTSKFQAGKPVRAIVYTEVTRFGHRPLSESSTRPSGANPSDRWAVELSQGLQLFHDADNVLAWSRPMETVIETSRNKRRDFFLVHEITLPSTLSIGAYKLKVRLKDGVTGHQDEYIISFEVVADPALASESSRGN